MSGEWLARSQSWKDMDAFYFLYIYNLKVMQVKVMQVNAKL